MPGGFQHKLMTRLAIDQLTGWTADVFDEQTKSLLLEEACLYPDAYFNTTRGGYEKTAPYALLIDGIQFHYLPDTPIKSEYKFWKVSDPDDKGHRRLERLRHETNENWKHAWTGFNYYIEKTVDCFKAGEPVEAVKFLGVLLHTLQDSVIFPHSLEGPDGVDVFALDRLIEPPGGDLSLLPSSVLGGRQIECDISGYSPRLLGTSASEAAFQLYSSYAKAVESSRKKIIPMLLNIYEGCEDKADDIYRETLSIGARLCADAAYTTLSIAFHRFEPDDISELQKVYLSDLKPVQKPRITSAPYGFISMTKDCALDDERQRRSLMLIQDGDRRSFSKGFGTGVHFDYTIAYELPADVYDTFTCLVGYHPELSRNADFCAGLRFRGNKIAETHITEDNPAFRLECDVRQGGLLELFLECAEGMSGDGTVSSVVWVDPLLMKAEV